MRGAWLVVLFAVGCTSSDSVECGDGVVCGPDRVCATVTWTFTAPATPPVEETKNFCVEQSQLDACADVAEGGACNGVEGATCHTGVCLTSLCGNRRVDAGENCDDGGQMDGDDCSGLCRFEICGNGIIDVSQGEQCDDTNFRDYDGCSSACKEELLDWHLVAPPTPANNVAAAFDAARDKVIMLNGFTGDVYEWDGVWRHTTPTSKPSPRQEYALTYAPGFGGVVLFGGTDAGAGLVIGFGSAYVWNGISWRVLPSGPALHKHSMAYDARRKKIVVFGGRSDTEGEVRNVWEFDGTTWTDVTPASAANAPSASVNSAMAYDPNEGLIILYVKTSTGGETWEYDGTTWTRQNIVSPDISRPRMTYVAGMGRPLLYGGINPGGSIVSTLYQWTGSAWTSPTTTGGRERLDVAMSDDGRGRLITFGGCNSKDGSNNCTTALGDTAFFDGTNWAVEQTPPNLLSVAAAQANGKIVRIGGSVTPSGSPDTDNKTWELSRRGWTSYSDGPGANDSPPPLRAATMVHDAQRDQFVLFGGVQAGDVKDSRTWIRTGSTWTLVPATPGLVGRTFHSMAYDHARGITVLFGGTDNESTLSLLGDTWTWNGTAWTNVTGSGPNARVGAALGFDYEHDLVVLFGGLDQPTFTAAKNDVWVFDGTTWSEVTNRVGEQPAPGFFHSFAWDPARRRLLLTGGFQRPFDTWEWAGSATESRWVRVSTLRLPPPRIYDTTMSSIDGSGITTHAGGVFPAGDPTTELWELRGSASRGADGCTFALDSDGDGLTGCDDPDCWPQCTPSCPPETSCPTGAPGCGDGICSSLESCQTCGDDCATCDNVCGDFVCDPSEACPGDCP